MDEFLLAEKSYQLIRKDLGLKEEIVLKDLNNDFDQLEEYLTKQVNHLLDHDFNALLNAMYRIDIPEDRVNHILYESSPDTLANNLARVIIEREKQKAITRLKYRPS